MKKKLVIIGAGGHGKVVASIAKLNGYEEIVFLDDDVSKKTVGNYLIVGTTKDILKYKEDYDFFVGIGYNKIRENITHQLDEYGIIQPKLIHPSAVIDETVIIEDGVVIMANAVVNADSKIEKGVIVNTAATVDHDCIIEKFTHVCPGSHLAGGIHVGKRVWVGIGSTIINNLSICDDCILGGGSVVIHSINESGTYVGNPVRKIK